MIINNKKCKCNNGCKEYKSKSKERANPHLNFNLLIAIHKIVSLWIDCTLKLNYSSSRSSSFISASSLMVSGVLGG